MQRNRRLRRGSEDASTARERNADGLARESKFRAIAEANRLQTT